MFAPAPDEQPTVKLDLFGMIGHASWPVRITIVVLVAWMTGVWIIAALKYLQMMRLRGDESAFERKTRKVASGADLYELVSARKSEAPGARVISELCARGSGATIERLRAIADRAIVDERKRARVFMVGLASVGSAAPFVGLFGTVWGIMDAFVRISVAKTASLPVVAPAIGEALITTAIGLAAAIPAVWFYNDIDKRIGDFVSELETSAAEWVALVAEQPPVDSAIPLVETARR
jgi:biopolymer transport protein TolQ